jgi:hypothetical protein
MVGAILGTKMSPRQARAVKEDHRKSGWATTEAMRGMGTRGGGLDGGADAPTSMFTPEKVELAIVLGAEASKRSKGILRKPRGNLKEENPGFDTEGISELTDDGVGCTRTRSVNPQKPGVKVGANVTKVFLQQQARAAELLAEQERATKRVQAAVNQAERLQMELTRRLAQLDAESDNIGIRVRGSDDDTIEPDIPGAGMYAEEVAKMIRVAMQGGFPDLAPPRGAPPPLTMASPPIESPAEDEIYYAVHQARVLGDEG